MDADGGQSTAKTPFGKLYVMSQAAACIIFELGPRSSFGTFEVNGSDGVTNSAQESLFITESFDETCYDQRVVLDMWYALSEMRYNAYLVSPWHRHRFNVALLAKVVSTLLKIKDGPLSIRVRVGYLNQLSSQIIYRVTPHCIVFYKFSQYIL